MIVTDLSDRERERFADQAHTIANEAQCLENALRARNDSETLVHLIMLIISGGFLKELSKIFENAAPVEIPNDTSTIVNRKPDDGT